jgi:L-asparagine transporter-like permease
MIQSICLGYLLAGAVFYFVAMNINVGDRTTGETKTFEDFMWEEYEKGDTEFGYLSRFQVFLFYTIVSCFIVLFFPLLLPSFIQDCLEE